MQEQQDEQKPPLIRVALLGTGIFGTNCSFPTIQKLSDKFKLVAVWSRRQESVEAFVEKNINNGGGDDDDVQGYSGEEGLDRILNNSTTDIDAVVIALPIDAQPRFIELALNAGKHVLSEKPIAANVEEARKLWKIYKDINHDQKQQLQWSVAENFRYEPAIGRVANAIKNNEIG